MSTQELIQDWFSNSLDYSEGISLLSKYCKNKTLIANLSKRESDFNTTKLQYELDKILENAKKTTKTLRERTAQPNAINESNIESVKNDVKKELLSVPIKRIDSNLQHSDNILLLKSEITSKRNDLYAKRNFMHAQLSSPIKSERKKLAKAIIEIQPKIDKHNKHLKFIEDNKTIPPELIKSNLTAEEYRAKLNAKTYISKYKKKLQNATTLKEKERFKALLNKYENLI